MKYVENSTTELKGQYTKSFLKSVSAFATYDGGKIYFGVDEASEMIVGVDNMKELRLKVENAIHDSISPRPSYEFDVKHLDGKDVLELTVIAGKEGPYFYNN